MPFAEFQNGNAGLALADFQLKSRDASFSLMERAQRMNIDRQRLEMDKQQLAGTLAVQNQQMAQSRAMVAQTQAATEKQDMENRLMQSTLDDQIKMSRDTIRQFTNADGGDASPFSSAVDRVMSMPVDSYQSILSAENAKNALVAEWKPRAAMNPTADRLFNIKVGMLDARINLAKNQRLIQADTAAQTLYTKMVSLSSPEQRDAFLKETGDNHITAMRNDAYRAQYDKVSERIASQDNQLRQQKEMAEVKFKQEQQMLAQKSTVEIPTSGISGVAPTPESAQEVRKAAAVYEPTRHALDDMISLAKKVEANVTSKGNVDYRADAETIHNNLVSAIGRLQTGSVLTEPEAERMKKTIPNPTDLLRMSSATMVRLNRLSDEIEAKMDSVARSNGLTRQRREAKPASGKSGKEIFGNTSPNGKPANRDR